MQAPRLVASDVDGTLLGPDDRVSPRTVAAVARVAAAGVPFVLVTGRPVRWIPPVVEQVPQVRLAVCANGALLYDVVADRVVWDRALPVDELIGLVADARATFPGCGLAVERAGGLDALPFLAESGYANAWPEHARIIDGAELVAEPAVKVLVREPRLSSAAMLAALAPVVGDRADLTFSHPLGLIEVSAPGITKGSGLAAVAASLEVDAADVVAFGDMPNDLALLDWAGHGVAMGNAHPALLEASDEVTADNADDGVALVLERWF